MSTHLVFLSAFNWGNLRPACGLAANLARKFPLFTISFIVDADFCSKAKAELSRHCTSTEAQTLLPRIRCISLGRNMEGMSPELMEMIAQMDPRDLHSPPGHVSHRISNVMPSILADEEFADDLNVKWARVGVKPTVIVCDFLMSRVALSIKEWSGLPVVLWMPLPALFFSRYLAPRAFGGQVEVIIRESNEVWSDERLRKGRSFDQIVQDVWATPAQSPTVVNLKGLPPFYQWEGCPQATWWKPFLALYDCQVQAYHLAHSADALILAAVPQLEHEIVEGIRSWFSGSDGKPPLFCVGPQLPVRYLSDNAMDNEGVAFGRKEVLYFHEPSGTEAVPVHAGIDRSIVFLDEALASRGPHSALYVSFGTLFFPHPGHVRILIETLLQLEEPMPFVFTLAAKGSSNPDAELSSDLLDMVAKSGRGIIVAWAPQQTILSHPALGWIVTHCGANGTFESLSQGVPTIAWPFMCDQTLHALWMSEVLDTGFELLQVRTGPGANKAYRGGPDGTTIIGTDEAIREEIRSMLAMCQGEVGERKRANAKRVKRLIREAKAENGDADTELNNFGTWLRGL